MIFEKLTEANIEYLSANSTLLGLPYSDSDCPCAVVRIHNEEERAAVNEIILGYEYFGSRLRSHHIGRLIAICENYSGDQVDVFDVEDNLLTIIKKIEAIKKAI